MQYVRGRGGKIYENNDINGAMREITLLLLWMCVFNLIGQSIPPSIRVW